MARARILRLSSNRSQTSSKHGTLRS